MRRARKRYRFQWMRWIIILLGLALLITASVYYSQSGSIHKNNSASNLSVSQDSPQSSVESEVLSAADYEFISMIFKRFSEQEANILINALKQRQMSQSLSAEEYEKTVRLIRGKVSEEEYNRLMLLSKKRWTK